MIFLKGEVRKIGIEVSSTKGEIFTIDSASYDVYKATDLNNSIDRGVCIIDNHTITMLFSASSSGVFFVGFTYKIKDEIMKARVTVEVKD